MLEEHWLDVTKVTDLLSSAEYGNEIGYKEDAALIVRTKIGSMTPAIETSKTQLSLSSDPNPTNQNCIVSWQMPSEGNTKIELRNSLGELMRVVFDGVSSTGINRINFDCSKYPSGTYFMKLSTCTESVIHKLIIVR